MEARGYNRKPVSFDSEGNTLYGNVWGDTDGDKLVVIAHGIGNYANGYYNEMAYFVDEGYCVMTYNCTGTYTSEGKGTTGLSQSPIDLHNALLFVESDPDLKDKDVYLFGHSWGGYAAAAIFHFDHDIAASASVSKFVSAPWNCMINSGLIWLAFSFSAARTFCRRFLFRRRHRFPARPFLALQLFILFFAHVKPPR